MSTPPAYGPPGPPGKRQAIAAEIAARIASGHYPPGTWLPTMAHLADDLSVSIALVHNALTDLATRNLVTCAPRKGHYAGTGHPPPDDDLPHRNGPATQPRATTHGSGLPAELAERYITVDEFRTTLGVSKMTVYRLVWEGQIPGTLQVGKAIRIPVSGALKYIESSVITGPQGDFDQFAGLADTADQP